MTHPLLDKNITVVQLILINETGDSYYRMRWPGMQLAKQAPIWRIINLDARAKERFEWGEAADLLIVYQSHDLDLLPLLKTRREQGKKTVVEYNDNFYSPPAPSPIVREWSSPLLWQSYEAFIEASDAVLVTGPGLDQLLGEQSSRPRYILENHLPSTPPPFAELWKDPGPEFRLGWAGSVGHMADILWVLPLLRELVIDHPELRLHIMGNEALGQMGRVPEDRFVFTPWGTMQEYFEFWKPVHLGIAPMLDTPYNRCRSDIKAIEMAGGGVLPLVSDLLPYRKFLGQTGLKAFKTPQELKAAIVRYIKNPGLLREDAERAYNYVISERLGEKRTERLNLYLQFLEETTIAASNPIWPVGAGYHEIEGAIQERSFSQESLMQAQEKLNKRDVPGAHTLLKEALKRNPFYSDLAVADIKCRVSLGDAAAQATVKEYVQKFPRDLRFQLLDLAYEKDKKKRKELWTALLNTLSQGRDEVMNFYHGEIIQIFSKDIRTGGELMPVGEELIKLYPNSSPLRFMLAEAYERGGSNEKALEHFSWLAEALDDFEKNQKFLAGITPSYIRTWKDALTGRVENSRKK